MNDIVKQAADYYCGGLYCSQAVLSAFCEKYGLGKEMAQRISFGLNSGFRCAEVYGAVSGAVLVVGLKHGDAKEMGNAKTLEYMNQFKEKHGSVICRDLLDCDIATPDGREKAVEQSLFSTKCVDLVRNAAQLLVDLGY